VHNSRVTKGIEETQDEAIDPGWSPVGLLLLPAFGRVILEFDHEP
jgi:hypothetical protein